MEEAHIPSNPSIGNKWMLNNDNDDDEYWRQRAGGKGLECAERVPEQGDLETTLPWPPPWGGFP